MEATRTHQEGFSRPASRGWQRLVLAWFLHKICWGQAGVKPAEIRRGCCQLWMSASAFESFRTLSAVLRIGDISQRAIRQRQVRFISNMTNIRWQMLVCVVGVFSMHRKTHRIPVSHPCSCVFSITLSTIYKAICGSPEGICFASTLGRLIQSSQRAWTPHTHRISLTTAVLSKSTSSDDTGFLRLGMRSMLQSAQMRVAKLPLKIRCSYNRRFPKFTQMPFMITGPSSRRYSVW